MRIGILILLTLALGCNQTPKAPDTVITPWVPYDESSELEANAEHESVKMQYKLIQSKVSDKNKLWKNISDQIAYFSEEKYQELLPLVLDQDIPTIQSHVKSGKLTYEQLAQWYLYRITKYENDPKTYLNCIISINPNVVDEAKKKDLNRSENDHPLYGIPVLLKDNINFKGLPTTAGTVFLKDNDADDAFITKQIKQKGGIILGKTNLSEWANYLCIDCPNGWSAVGGQTLNPYGRMKFDTGGSSSGSGSAIAANYASVAVGTETSGSILSPSSTHSLVGLKPTTGLLSRGGIVPLSSTLDTPGPMTKNIIDNAIFVSALVGKDSADPITKQSPENKTYWEDLKSGSLEGVHFGVNKRFLEDENYKENVEKIKSLGGIMIEFEPPSMDFEGFGTMLNADMSIDLPNYLDQYGMSNLSQRSIQEIVEYNQVDSTLKVPYGQGRFERILSDKLEFDELVQLREKLNKNGIQFFESIMSENKLDVVLSINNFNAGHAAAAKYPCLTVSMGYKDSGEPIGLTFIAKPYEEDKLLKLGYAFEKETKMRKSPTMYR